MMWNLPVLMLLLAVAHAQSNSSTLRYNSTQCADAGGHQPSLQNGVQVCVLSYQSVCGIEVCNDYDQKCVDLPDHMGKACISKGAFMHPDAAVLIFAQLIASGLMIPFGFVYILLNIKVRNALLPTVTTTMIVAFSFPLFFSYYYLNAYIIVAATFGSLVLFAQKKQNLTVAGMILCLLALLWVCFRSGLGNMQHHSRFAAGDSINDTFEKYCDAYYRGFWFSPGILKSYDENPQVKTWGFCNRYWLACVLFFMILQELLLVLHVGAACLSCDIHQPPIVQEPSVILTPVASHHTRHRVHERENPLARELPHLEREPSQDQIPFREPSREPSRERHVHSREGSEARERNQLPRRPPALSTKQHSEREIVTPPRLSPPRPQGGWMQQSHARQL
jgi:hypothetical protein